MDLKATRVIKATPNGLVLKSGFIKEDLPLPFVLYPDWGGVFIGFSSKLNGKVFFCSCSATAIKNYFRLRNEDSANFIQTDFPSGLFPSSIGNL